MTTARKTVLFAAVALFAVWLIANLGFLVGDDDGIIRFTLGTLFSVLLLLRWKEKENVWRAPSWLTLGSVALGTVLVLVGKIVPIHQFEWLGLIFLLYGALRWSLPDRCGKDLLLALFILYWIHPLPAQVFSAFQVSMQKLSVGGSEWVLHCFNERVWADGMVLYAGQRVFGVPESCSGMRTAVTVLLCTLGVGMLFRFRWYEILTFLVLGIVQVLILNIVRITSMIVLAPRMPPEWGSTFLHDTLGVFLLVTMVLVQVEASSWKVWSDRRRRIKRGIRSGELEIPDRASPLPMFWRLILRWTLPALLVVVLLLGSALAVYKRRPWHRSMMVRGVVDELINYDLETAEAAVLAAMELTPLVDELKSRHFRILVLRGKHEEALAALADMPRDLGAHLTILKSWCLMGTGRETEAIELLNGLPERWRDQPGVAIVKAEYAAMQDEPAQASHYVLVASRMRMLINRVRRLYPYLAARKQWDAIAGSDADVPYREFIYARAAVDACMRSGKMAAAATTLRNVLKQWPNEPELLRFLAAVAASFPDSAWEERFAESLTANLDTLSPDEISAAIHYSFRMKRPDLAWMAYAKLQATDPTDPSLSLAVAQYGASWFTFRRRDLGLESAGGLDTIDLRVLCALTRDVPLFRRLWRRVPLSAELGVTDTGATRARYLERAINELERRDRDGTISVRMLMAYPSALAIAGRYDEAHAKLGEIARLHPERKQDALARRIELYSQQEEWENVYESFWEYRAAAGTPDIEAVLQMVNASLNINLGVCALGLAERSKADFPGSPEPELAIAGIWDMFGFKDHALHILRKTVKDEGSPTYVRLLYETGRFQEAEQASRALSFPMMNQPSAAGQLLVAPSAEVTLRRRWDAPLSAERLAAAAAEYEKRAKAATSPFVAALSRISAAWHRAPEDPAANDPELWTAIARYPEEKAAALHRLCVLHARQLQFEQAVRAAELALEHMPASPVLWRLLVALTEGEPDVVDRAVAARPDDPEIWLASLAVHKGTDADPAIVLAEMEDVVANSRFPPEALVRAGDLLLRRKLIAAATVLAEDVVANSSGYIPAYVLGLRCALAAGDQHRALACALEATERALDPSPFYKVIVDLKSAGQSTDADMLAALEYLSKRFPARTALSEQLGHAYFQKGDIKRVLTVLGPAMKEHYGDLRVESLMLAAEAARLTGDDAQAIRILEKAYGLHPDNLEILNNLVYYLAQNSATLPRSLALLPALVEIKDSSFSTLDTIATVYLKSGDLVMAEKYMDLALKSLDSSGYSPQEVSLNAAELLFRKGDYEGARRLCGEIRKDSDRSEVVDRGVRALLAQIERKLAEQ